MFVWLPFYPFLVVRSVMDAVPGYLEHCGCNRREAYVAQQGNATMVCVGRCKKYLDERGPGWGVSLTYCKRSKAKIITV
jgi:hypothetical protein